MKKIALILFLFLFLFPVNFVLGLNYEATVDPNSKGDYLLNFFRTETDNASTFRVNMRLSGTRINEVIFTPDSLQVPTCSTNNFFDQDRLCFDIAFATLLPPDAPIFQVKVTNLGNGSLNITDLETYNTIASPVSITPTQTELPENLITPENSSWIMPILVVASILSFFVIILIIKLQRDKFFKIMNVLVFLILGLSLMLAVNYIAAPEFESLKTISANVSPRNISGCFRDKLLVRFLQGQPHDFTNFPVTYTASNYLGFNTYEITLAPEAGQSDLELDAIYKNLKKFKGIEYIDFSCPSHAAMIPNDPFFAYQQGYMDLVNYPEAWDMIHDTASDVVISIIDSGFNSNKDVAGNIWINPGETPSDRLDNDGNGYIDDIHGWNFTKNSNNVPSNSSASTWHGSSVMSIIGAEGNNSLAMTGGAWKTKMMLLSTAAGANLPLSNMIDMAAALKSYRYSRDKEAAVINASFGGDKFMFNDCKAIQDLGRKGIVFVNSAGNENWDIDNGRGKSYPCAYDLDNIICVGALSGPPNYNSKHPYSNWGKKSVDIFAPGTNVVALDSNLADPTARLGSLFGMTSGAAPFVTAAVGLYQSKYPNATPVQVKTALIASATKVSRLANLAVSGGILNVEQFLKTDPATVQLPPARTTDPCTNLPITPTATNTTEPTNEPSITPSITGTATATPTITPTITGIPDKCKAINNWADMAGYYCEPGANPKVSIYCDALKQEVPDRNIDCSGSACVQYPAGQADRCAVDRCQQLGDRWANQAGHYCSADNNYLIYCTIDKKEIMLRSKRCSSGCQINPKGVADVCISSSANLNQEIITDPSEDPVIPVNEPNIMNQVVCGPLDGNKNGTIDRGDLGYMAMVYSTLTLSKQCSDKNVDYGILGGMDTNKDGVVDNIDLAAFVSAYNK